MVLCNELPFPERQRVDEREGMVREINVMLGQNNRLEQN